MRQELSAVKTELAQTKQQLTQLPNTELQQELTALRQVLEEQKKETNTELDALKKELERVTALADTLQNTIQNMQHTFEQQRTSRQSNTAKQQNGQSNAEIQMSWEAIHQTIRDGSYKTKFKLGDFKYLNLGAEGMIRMQIVAFDRDFYATGEEKAAITWLAQDLLATPICMNKIITGHTRQHWKYAEVRNYLQTTIYPHLPESLRNMIVPVKKASEYHDGNGLWEDITSESLWIPCCKEISNLAGKNEQSSVSYTDFISKPRQLIKKVANAPNAECWWLRSAFSNNAFSAIDKDGRIDYRTATKTGYIALGFCT